MTAVVYKTMAAIARSGFSVDVVCADSFCKALPLDYSLLPFAEDTFGTITRLRPSQSIVSRLLASSNIFRQIPDVMTTLQESAYETLMDMDLGKYDAIMTWSPFHSINAVMVRVKKARPNVRWIAQFSDPWVDNPLEISRLTKFWNKLYEPRAVKAADFIVCTSRYSLDLMLKNNSEVVRSKTEVIPHAYDERLYPLRPKTQNDKILLRCIGKFHGRRSPEPLFQALANLFERRPDLLGRLCLELIGSIPEEMLQTKAALSLLGTTIFTLGSVSFVESVEKMYDADILILVEANIRQNLFLPSKLSDYIGARTPIVGLVPPGGSEDALKHLGSWFANPGDIYQISKAIEGAVVHVMTCPDAPWCNESYRNTFNGTHVANRFTDIIAKL